jgi:N-acetylneuraminic acid mutarotase
MSVASVGNVIIAALGFDPGAGDTSVTRIYDIATDTWSLGADAPGPSSEGAGIAHGGLLYNIGGRGAGFNANWSYDPVTDTWNAGLEPLPSGRNGLAVAVVGHAIYAIGGRTAGGGPCSGFGAAVLDTVERYDIASDAWTEVAPLLSPRQDLAAASVGGKIYVFGGCDESGIIVGDVDVYDPTTDSWDFAPTDMPNPRASFYPVETKGGTVYAIGGWDGVGFGLSTNDAYKVSQDEWTTDLLPMPTPRAEVGAAGHGGRIYIVGGGQPGFGAAVDANEVFKP